MNRLLDERVAARRSSRTVASRRAPAVVQLLPLYGGLVAVTLAEETLPSAFWPYASVALLTFFVLLLGRHFLAPMAILLPVIMAKLLLALSLLFIGHRLPIRELGIVAQGQVHSGYYALVACAFLHIAAQVFALLVRTFPPARVRLTPVLQGLFLWSVIGAACVAIFFLFHTGATQGFALLEGADRFAYRAGQDWFFGIVMTFKPILAGLIGFVRFRLSYGRAMRLTLSLLFGVLFAESALFGEKFLSLLVMTGFFFMPFLVLQNGLPRRRLGLALCIAVGSGLIVSALTYHVYSDYGALDLKRTTERLAGRFTGQGQLWYAVMHGKPALAQVDRAEVARMGAAMMAREADRTAFDTRSGMFHLVTRFAPDAIRASILERKGRVQFTGATEAYLALVLGHLPMIAILALLGCLAGLIAYYVYDALIAASLPGYFFALFILSNFASMMNQASFWQIFGARAVLYIAAMLATDMVFRMMCARNAPLATRRRAGTRLRETGKDFPVLQKTI